MKKLTGVDKEHGATKRAEYLKCWKLTNRDKINSRRKELRQNKNKKDKEAAAYKIYYENNKAKMIEKTKRWQAVNSDKIKITAKLTRAKNPNIYRAKCAKRNAMKLQAMPKWANQKYIELWYEHCKLEEQRTGRKCHVDHIVPLQGKTVCGLHNEFNLQVLFAEDNIRKGNRVWPDMPGVI